ncbi:hypothetical protein EIP75_02130 [Aquabacterium soli]|uniref:Uncharacterized protein n=1 Tax=Aquabacterium soli TaxID=2493092 RepID=A0A426VHL3_9BURK|nr:hypothetical protein [Aquabacterium soli]RRS06403.1 hypothetical protein EIP75_02130 [Aquabacterium soli]
MEMSSRDVIEHMFAQRVSNPASWFRNSRALFAAARASRDRFPSTVDMRDRADLDRVTSMLYGFGLECLFKAVIVLADFGDPNAEEWTPAATFPKKLGTHDLVKLAGMISTDLVTKHELALGYFTEAAVWMGRYPCSKDGAEGSICIVPRFFADAEAIYAEYAIQFSISG